MAYSSFYLFIFICSWQSDEAFHIQSCPHERHRCQKNPSYIWKISERSAVFRNSKVGNSFAIYSAQIKKQFLNANAYYIGSGGFRAKYRNVLNRINPSIFLNNFHKSKLFCVGLPSIGDNEDEQENSVEFTRQNVDEALGSIREYMASHGGYLELIDIDNDSYTVYVRLKGSCVGCAYSKLTLENGLEASLRQIWPSVKIKSCQNNDDNASSVTSWEIKKKLNILIEAIESTAGKLRFEDTESGKVNIIFDGINGPAVRVALEMELRDKFPDALQVTNFIFPEENE